MPLAIFVVCGILHIVGSERDASPVLDDGAQRIALEGPVADHLVGSTWNHICVEGERTGHLGFGTAFGIRVIRSRPVGDGRHAPIVGIIRRSKTGDIVQTEDGKRFLIRIPSSWHSGAWIGVRLWLIGRWDRDHLDVTRAGPF